LLSGRPHARGRVLADAPPRDLTSLLPGSVLEVVAHPRATTEAALRGITGVLDVQPFAAAFHVRVAKAATGEALIRSALAAAAVRVEAVRQIPASLEDTFLHLTRTSGVGPVGEAA